MPRCKFLAKKGSRVQLHENGEPPGAVLFWSSGSAGRYYSKIRALLCSYATLVSISNAIPAELYKNDLRVTGKLCELIAGRTSRTGGFS